MRKILLALALGMASGGALACDDHVGKCEIEAWRYTHTPAMRVLTIEGSASCDKGSAKIRLFTDPEKSQFLGVADGLIEGHALNAVAFAIYEKPEALFIRYSIQPR